METGNRSKVARQGGLSALLVMVLLLGGAQRAAAQFNSGSSGKHGVFPPLPAAGSVPANYTFLVWNVATGIVRYCSSYTMGTGLDQCDSGSDPDVSAQIPNVPAGGLTTGVYEFTDFDFVATVGIHRYLVLAGTSSNRPLTILAQGDITVSGAQGYQVFFHANGDAGKGTNTNFSVAGGRGGPAGFAGGASGNGGTDPGSGGAGFGPSGGAAGNAAATTLEALQGQNASASPLNPSLTPLTGGSGGGGAAGTASTNSIGCGQTELGLGGGGGGGGGGALLLAASGRVTLGWNAVIDVRGGSGGLYWSCGLSGGGGAGGSVRIVAQEIAGSGSIYLGGGSRANGGLRAPGGLLRMEAAVNTFGGQINDAAGGSFLAFPTSPIPANQATLRITAIGGQNTPPTPQAALTAPDITFPAAVTAPVTLFVAGSNIPLGTPVTIKVVPAVGEPTAAVTSGLSGSEANSTAEATVTIPPGAGIVTASASFTLTGTNAAYVPRALPTIDGEKPQRVEVVAGGDGTSRAYLVGRSGARFELGVATR
jgi:hypothetical protein